MLWLCLNFPDLPINIFSIDRTIENPIAIIGPSNTIIAINKKCQSLGIKNGMSLSAAYAISNLIEVKHRNKHKEARYKPNHRVVEITHTAIVCGKPANSYC